MYIHIYILIYTYISSTVIFLADGKKLTSRMSANNVEFRPLQKAIDSMLPTGWGFEGSS